MIQTMRSKLALALAKWGHRLSGFAQANIPRQSLPILIFFHGYSLAHTLRPLVIAKALRQRGYPVELAGEGPHADKVAAAGFAVHPVTTMPQERMDEYVARGAYDYYDREWTERCARSERELIRRLGPQLVIQDMKPTAPLAAALEGVDAASLIQGYAQPGYPFPIDPVHGFATNSPALGQYLADKGDEVQAQAHHYLVADIPEFHPSAFPLPGFSYVGPLLDHPAEPDRLPLLDEGWDLSLPLLYVSCGSSGRPAEYLDDLLAALGRMPFRVLLTTAGRWGGDPDAHPNVRVVDFLPGDWILRRAHALIGTVGIGAIYQALRWGVPIIGAPEHLDQEYHLNRVQALGLGCKMDRRDFNAERIVRQLRALVEDYGQFKTRCVAFSRKLDRWDNDNVAEKVDHMFAQKMGRANESKTYRTSHPSDEKFHMPAGEFAHYLDRCTPRSLAPAEIREILRTGLQRGMPHHLKAGQPHYDWIDSWNWLYDNEPRFFEADYAALERKRRSFFSRRSGKVMSSRPEQKYKVDYALRVYADALGDGQQAKVFMPYPVPAFAQQDIALTACEPQGLVAYHRPSLGFFYGYPLAAGHGDFIDLGYSCTLTVREQSAAAGYCQPGLSAAERGRHTEIDPNLRLNPRAREILDQLGDGGNAGRARAIYDLLVRDKRYVKTKDLAHTLEMSAAAVLDGDGGHCITLTQAFIALCRAAGIPAREVTGALIGYPVAEREYEIRTYKEGVFGHTWAEVYDDGQGWIPVEFHGVVIAKNALTAANAQSPEIVETALANTDPYLDYYFGNLDTQRLTCSSSARDIPQCLVAGTGAPGAGAGGRWGARDGLRFECRMKVTCLP